MSIETLRGLATAAGHGEVFRAPALVQTRSDDPSYQPGSSLENPRTSWDRVFDVPASYSGVNVTEISALQLAAVWRCVSLIAGTIAKVPTNIYRHTDNGKERAPDHYLWNILRSMANPRLTAFRFKRLMQTWLCLWGNAYAEIELNGRGQVVGLWPWRPDCVSIFTLDDVVIYKYTPKDASLAPRYVPADLMLHLRGLEVDGLLGLSPIRAARQSLGLAMAAEEYGARYFGQSGKPGGWIEVPQKLGPTALMNLRQSLADVHAGLHGSHRLGIFEEGMKYHDVGVDPEDMQFLQTRQFQAVDIARLFGVPPHKIAELSRATFSNIESQGIDFVNDCIADWVANWEAEGMASLLSQREAASVFIKFDLTRLMRGDMAARYSAYNIGRQGGWLSSNDIRDAEDMNRIEGGDSYLVPLNMVDATIAAETEPAAAGEEDDPNEPADTGKDKKKGDK